MKRDAREKLVPPVFTLNDSVTRDALLSFDRFSQSISRWRSQGLSAASGLPESRRPISPTGSRGTRCPRSCARTTFRGPGRRPEPARGLPFAGDRGSRAASGRGPCGGSHRASADPGGTGAVRGGAPRPGPDTAISADQMEARAAERAGTGDEKETLLSSLARFRRRPTASTTLSSRRRAGIARAPTCDPVVEKLARGQVLARTRRRHHDSDSAARSRRSALHEDGST